MDGIDRVSLYRSVLRILEERQDYRYGFIGDWVDGLLNLNLIKILDFNITMLSGIEENFLINSRDTKFDKSEFEKVYISNRRKSEGKNYGIKREKIQKLWGFPEEIRKSKDEYYAFNQLVNLLNEINNNQIQVIKIDRNTYDERLMGRRFKRRKVFLSHAFDDKLYTLSLFIFMLTKEIFLYVDWLFSPEFKSGTEIKENLSWHLSNSNQLLFLRTINSEFSINGSGNIRGWCSWELGTFYAMNEERSDNKYYIELYRPKKYEKTRRNKQLDGINPLKNIIEGELV